jgi:hypothetical protein
MPYEIPPLQTLSETLEDLDYAVKFLPASKEIPIDILLVHLGDTPEQNFILEMTFVNDLLAIQGIPEEFDDSLVLQFLVRYPFSFAESAAAELALLLLRLNAIVPAGAFGLDEKVGTIFLRHALHLNEREVSEIVLDDILGSIDTFVTAFAPAIQEVAWGQKSRQEVLEALQNDGFTFPPMLPGPASLLNETPAA